QIRPAVRRYPVSHSPHEPASRLNRQQTCGLRRSSSYRWTCTIMSTLSQKVKGCVSRRHTIGNRSCSTPKNHLSHLRGIRRSRIVFKEVLYLSSMSCDVNLADQPKAHIKTGAHSRARQQIAVPHIPYPF